MAVRDDPEFRSPPSILHDVPPDELEAHRDFVLRHIDFLIDMLTGEQFQQQWAQPSGCPSATPEMVARRRKDDKKYPCRYWTLTLPEQRNGIETDCPCEDPLAGSDDPLDTVAAVAIARDDRTPGQRYFDTEDRQLIARLRRNVGTWGEIASLGKSRLEAELQRATGRPGIAAYRVDTLVSLLEAVASSEFTDGVTLRNVSTKPYRCYREMLAGFPGIAEADTWWLLLVAFDKPVWPADPFIDRLLCSLGLLDTDEFGDGAGRREELEDLLTDRQISSLHRALAGHAIKGHEETGNHDCEIRKFLLPYRIRRQISREEGPSVIDLFSGAGGLSLGFSRAGYVVEWAIDNDRYATDTYRLNHPKLPHEDVVCDDIVEAIDSGILEEFVDPPDVIIGGPPCQALSQAGYRSRLAQDEEYSVLDDERTVLYRRYVEVVEALRPKVLVMENVEGMMNEVGDTGIRVGDLVLESLEAIGSGGPGYRCDFRLVHCSDLGIPQKRDRVIILGIREDVATGPEEVHELFERILGGQSDSAVSLQQGLAGIPKIRRGEGGNVAVGLPPGRRSHFVTENELDQKTGLCFNHQAREHPMEKDRTLFDEAMEPGDTSWDVKYRKDEYSDLIEYDVGTEENPRFSDKYRMLRWDEPAPTVVAHLAKDANNFILPDYFDHVSGTSGEPDRRRNRGITAREAARLQTFPDDHIFLGPFGSWFRQIGNAVPPLLGERIGTAVREYLAGKAIETGEPVQGRTGQITADD